MMTIDVAGWTIRLTDEGENTRIDCFSTKAGIEPSPAYNGCIPGKCLRRITCPEYTISMEDGVPVVSGVGHEYKMVKTMDHNEIV